MEDMPIVSIIVPVFNVEKYLPQCILSIKNQTYNNIEVFLVDDGSTDASGTICDEASKQEPRFKTFHKPNGGLSDARNYGIERASGKWITFIDSDDYISPEYIEYLLNLALNNQTKIAAGAHTIFYESGKKYYKGFGETSINLFSQKEALQHILLDDGLDLSAWAKLYSADLFKEIRYPKGLSFEDTATTYKLFFQCDQIVCGSKSIYNYRIRSNSITTQANFNKKIQLIENTKVMCNDIISKYPELSDAAERRLIWAYFSTLNQLLKCPDKKSLKAQEKELVSFLKSKRRIIKNGCTYSKRDKLASITLCLGLPFYNFIWNIYSKLCKS